MKAKPVFLTISATISLLLALGGCATVPRQTASHDAPLLSRNPENPLYFADPTGQAVYLTGSHTWNNLQDKGPGDPPAAFDWDYYLDFLVTHNHNFIRLWSSQIMHDGKANGGAGGTPLPWQRTGLGLAADGKPRFDLTRFNETYFDRLRHRIGTAWERGIYVDVMLFEGWCATIGNSKTITWHAFAGGNNINGVDILRNPRENVYARWVSLDDPEVVRLQELYVRKVVETVNGFDNVLFEIANEPTGLSHEWQEHFIDYIRACEKNLPRQHMIGAPGGMKTYNARTFASGADFVAPDIQSPEDPYRARYKNGTATWGEPAYDHGNKVVFLDTDHLWGIGGNVTWAWQSFCRGYNVLYMDPATDWPGAYFDGNNIWTNVPNEGIRREMGVVRAYATRMDLNRAFPANSLSSTGYCLAQPGQTYLVIAPEGGSFTVRVEPGTYAGEWHDPQTGGTTPVKDVLNLSSPATFVTTAGGPAVLFLRKAS